MIYLNLRYSRITLGTLFIAILMTFSILATRPALAAASAPASVSCAADKGKKFLGIFPTWYEYISDYSNNNQNGEVSKLKDANGNFVTICGTDPNGSVALKEHATQVGLALIDILLRAGALAAVAFVIMGGYKYISSQGEPKNIEAAMATIVNAAIGLGIVILATVLVAFIGNRLGG